MHKWYEELTSRLTFPISTNYKATALLPYVTEYRKARNVFTFPLSLYLPSHILREKNTLYGTMEGGKKMSR